MISERFFRTASVSTLLALGSIGCAGPLSPLGPYGDLSTLDPDRSIEAVRNPSSEPNPSQDLFGPQLPKNQTQSPKTGLRAPLPPQSKDLTAPNLAENTDIQVLPRHLVFHRKFTLKINTGPLGPDEVSSIRVYYNHADVTQGFVRVANRTWAVGHPSDNKHWVLKSHWIHLGGERDHKIAVRIGGRYIPLAQPECQPYSDQIGISAAAMAREAGNVDGALRDSVLSKEFVAMIRTVALSEGISADLLAALIATESRFDPLAVSPKRALGLAQFTFDSAIEVEKSFAGWRSVANSPLSQGGFLELKRDVSASNLTAAEDWRLDPEKSLRAAAVYLKSLLARNHDDVRLALAAYHAGPGRMARSDLNTLTLTRRYVNNVLSFCQALSEKEDSSS